MSLVGFLESARGVIGLPDAFRRVVSLDAISVGSRASFESLVTASETGALRPVIDRSFPFAEHRRAFEHLAAARHFGEIVIEVGGAGQP